jgi:ammonium transporter, Amt family
MRLAAAALLAVIIALPATLIVWPNVFGSDALPESVLLVSPIKQVWLLVAAMLVFLMQIGFMLFESASIQSKNAQSVAVKNFLNLVAVWLAYLVAGYGLMLGASEHGLFGTTRFSWSEHNSFDYCRIAYHAGFAAVVATITSSALVERSSILANVIFSLFIGAVLFPLFGHWAWYPDGSAADLEAATSLGWLNGLAFHDFAGSTVVHCLGGFAALAGVIVLGKRRSVPIDFIGHLPLATIGVLFLWIGWIGFNGGSAASIDDIGRVILNTNLAAVAGGAAATLLIYCFRNKEITDWHRILVGAMGGLVAITAGSLQLTWWAALIVGALAGPFTVSVAHVFSDRVLQETDRRQQFNKLYLYVVHATTALVGGLLLARVVQRVAPFGRNEEWLLYAPTSIGFVVGIICGFVFSSLVWHVLSRRDIDDPVDAIAVHGFAGALGTLLVGVFGRAAPEVQVVGLTTAILWSFLCSYLIFWALNRLNWLRVPPHEEAVGVGRTRAGVSRAIPFWMDHEKLLEMATIIPELETLYMKQMTGAAHQVMSPLRGAIGLLEGDLQMGVYEAPSPDAIKRAYHFLKVAMFRANNLKILSQLETEGNVGQGTAAIVPLSRIVTKTTELYKFLGLHYQVKLEWIPPRDDVPVRETDGLIEQAVMNLVDNAIYYAHKDSTVTLWVERIPSGKYVQHSVAFHVCNIGLPIPPDDRARVFDRYYRTDQASTKRPDGTGIGLYIVHRIAEIHGGKVYLKASDSNPHVTEFVLELPIA